MKKSAIVSINKICKQKVSVRASLIYIYKVKANRKEWTS